MFLKKICVQFLFPLAIVVSGIFFGYIVKQGITEKSDIFNTKENIYLNLYIPQDQYERAKELFETQELASWSDVYFSWASLDYTIGSQKGSCDDILWRPGGQSKRKLPTIIDENWKRYLTPTSYKLKFSKPCLWTKKLKAEYFTEPRALSDNLFVRDLYQNLWLSTPLISPGKMSVQIGEILPSHWIYSFDETLDDDFLERVFPDGYDKWWLFRVNALWNRSGSLLPLSPEEISEYIWIDSEDGKKLFVYDLKTMKKDFETGKEKLLKFIDDISQIKEWKKSAASVINIQDLVTITAINSIVGNTDDYATQGNNYYIFLPAHGRAVRIFGVDFDEITFSLSPRDFMIKNHKNPLYDIVMSDPEVQEYYLKVWQKIIRESLWLPYK
jgi:hypothetical protein